MLATTAAAEAKQSRTFSLAKGECEGRRGVVFKPHLFMLALEHGCALINER